ncbi:beta-mannosidase, partial [Micromonospora craterilacus]
STPPPSTPPPTTPPPSTPPPTTTPPAGAGCTATYSITNQWQGGFQGDVRVTAGASAINGWTVRWTFANGQSVTQFWNATVTGSGATVTARNVDYNGRLGARASTSFGFLGSWNGTNSAPAVTCTAS